MLLGQSALAVQTTRARLSTQASKQPNFKQEASAKAIDEIERMLDTKTVVGEPITAEGHALMPLVSVGFAAGEVSLEQLLELVPELEAGLTSM